jgi:biopolymer transport protein ExbD
MKIKRRQGITPGESSAASDVAFLLIIYFLVIAGFNINQGFLMNLPAKDSTRLILKDDLMRFEMDSSGAVFYENEKLNISEAEREIRLAIASHPNLAVVLSIDGKAPWQQVVDFVELAQKLNVDSFSFNMSSAHDMRENS